MQALHLASLRSILQLIAHYYKTHRREELISSSHGEGLLAQFLFDRLYSIIQEHLYQLSAHDLAEIIRSFFSAPQTHLVFSGLFWMGITPSGLIVRYDAM